MEWLLIVTLYWKEVSVTIREMKSEELCNKVGVMLTNEMNRNPQTPSYINWRGVYKCIPNK